MSPLEQQLHDAVRLGDKTRIREFAGAGADVNSKDSEGNIPLCGTEDGDVIQLLLSLGANPNVACSDGMTPLVLAVMGQTPITAIRALLDAGANPNTAGGFGMTPLMHAAGNREIEVVSLLLSVGANVTTSDALGKNALHSARQRPEIVALLKSTGCK